MQIAELILFRHAAPYCSDSSYAHVVALPNPFIDVLVCWHCPFRNVKDLSVYCQLIGKFLKGGYLLLWIYAALHRVSQCDGDVVGNIPELLQGRGVLDEGAEGELGFDNRFVGH